MLVNAPFAVRRGKVLRCPTGSICVGGLRAVLTGDKGLIVIGPESLPTVKAWTWRPARRRHALRVANLGAGTISKIENHSASASNAAAGGGTAHNNVQPTIICNKILRVV
jgi:hypothetical protein